MDRGQCSILVSGLAQCRGLLWVQVFGRAKAPLQAPIRVWGPFAVWVRIRVWCSFCPRLRSGFGVCFGLRFSLGSGVCIRFQVRWRGPFRVDFGLGSGVRFVHLFRSSKVSISSWTSAWSQGSGLGSELIPNQGYIFRFGSV